MAVRPAYDLTELNGRACDSEVTVVIAIDIAEHEAAVVTGISASAVLGGYLYVSVRELKVVDMGGRGGGRSSRAGTVQLEVIQACHPCPVGVLGRRMGRQVRPVRPGECIEGIPEPRPEGAPRQQSRNGAFRLAETVVVVVENDRYNPSGHLLRIKVLLVGILYRLNVGRNVLVAIQVIPVVIPIDENLGCEFRHIRTSLALGGRSGFAGLSGQPTPWQMPRCRE